MADSGQAATAGGGPRYVRLANVLRSEILGGAYSSADSFPTEAMLCERFAVSRFTVREALRQLQSEGLIARKRGSGTLIQPAAARGGALHQPLSNVGEILQYAQGTRVDLKPDGSGPVPRRYAEQIEGDVSGHWLRFRGVRCEPGEVEPIAAVEAFVHSRFEPIAARFDPSRTTLFQQIHEIAGTRVARVTQDIQAVPASREVAQTLGIAPRAPCLRVLRCFHDPSGWLFEVSASHHPGDRFAYSMHIDVDR